MPLGCVTEHARGVRRRCPCCVLALRMCAQGLRPSGQCQCLSSLWLSRARLLGGASPLSGSSESRRHPARSLRSENYDRHKTKQTHAHMSLGARAHNALG